MRLIYVHGEHVAVLIAAGGHIVPIAPEVAVLKIPYDGGRIGPLLAIKGKRIRLVYYFTHAGLNCVFVCITRVGYAYESLPYSGFTYGVHGICVFIPAVKAAYYPYGHRVWRPYRKTVYFIAPVLGLMAAQSEVCI